MMVTSIAAKKKDFRYSKKDKDWSIRSQCPYKDTGSETIEIISRLVIEESRVHL